MAIKIKPLGDRVIIKPAEPKEVVKGGIIIPDSAKEKPMQGEVVAVGKGALNKKGERLPMDVKVGDIVNVQVLEVDVKKKRISLTMKIK